MEGWTCAAARGKKTGTLRVLHGLWLHTSKRAFRFSRETDEYRVAGVEWLVARGWWPVVFARSDEADIPAFRPSEFQHPGFPFTFYGVTGAHPQARYTRL